MSTAGSENATLPDETKLIPENMTEEEKQIFERYGRIPGKNDLIKKRNERLKGRKPHTFDSADWELKKKASTTSTAVK